MKPAILLALAVALPATAEETVFRSYWPDGTLKYEAQMQGNTVHGYVRRYYDNGQLAYQGQRWQGREYGQSVQCFHRDGSPMSVCTPAALMAGLHTDLQNE